MLALAGSIALLALTAAGDSDDSPEGGENADSPPADESAALVEQAAGELRTQGERLAARDVTVSEGLGIKAVDVSTEAGIFEHTLTHGSLVIDLDNDGWDDVLVNRHYFAYPRLYRNNGDGTFADITGTAIPQSERDLRDPHGCDAADVNRDGLIDIFCSTGGAKGVAPNPKKLWIQQRDGTFRSEEDRYGVEDRWGRGRVATFVDANGDGYPDLFHGTTPERSDDRPSPNRLFVNEDGMRFREAPEYGVTSDEGANTVEAADFDRDGLEDLLLCSKGGGIRLYRNVANERFEDAAREANVDANCRAAAFGDVDGDGSLDLIYLLAGSVHVRVQRQGRFERFYDLDVNDLIGLAVGDVNGDGLADIYVVRGGPPDADYGDLMLVNRGNGRFVNMLIPQTRAGEGESATAIDYDRNGLTDFVVMNGNQDSMGPVRLIAFEKLAGSR